MGTVRRAGARPALAGRGPDLPPGSRAPPRPRSSHILQSVEWSTLESTEDAVLMAAVRRPRRCADNGSAGRITLPDEQKQWNAAR
ncbi:hypothetical protein ACRAWF_32330 [Streptomyces sp. L7]